MKNQTENFDLAQTLDCGQCFRWERQKDGSYTGVAFSRVLNISKENRAQVLEDELWRNYFDVQLNYGRIRTDLSEGDTVLAEAAKFAPGMRILNQEPWEALCSFIISQNNNIPRIKGIVARLCTQFGEEIGGGYFSFPTPEKLAELKADDLAEIRSGFRAKYILSAAQKVANGEVDLAALKTAPLPEARAMPMGFGLFQRNSVQLCCFLFKKRESRKKTSSLFNSKIGMAF